MHTLARTHTHTGTYRLLISTPWALLSQRRKAQNRLLPNLISSNESGWYFTAVCVVPWKSVVNQQNIASQYFSFYPKLASGCLWTVWALNHERDGRKRDRVAVDHHGTHYSVYEALFDPYFKIQMIGVLVPMMCVCYQLQSGLPCRSLCGRPC